MDPNAKLIIAGPEGKGVRRVCRYFPPPPHQQAAEVHFLVDQRRILKNSMRLSGQQVGLGG